MNRKELGNRIADFIWGQKVEGTISAVLPSAIINSSRYLITTQNEVLDAHVPAIENHGIFYYSYTFHPLLEKGSKISLRLKNVKPWVDGQSIHFGT